MHYIDQNWFVEIFASKRTPLSVQCSEANETDKGTQNQVNL